MGHRMAKPVENYPHCFVSLISYSGSYTACDRLGCEGYRGILASQIPECVCSMPKKPAREGVPDTSIPISQLEGVRCPECLTDDTCVRRNHVEIGMIHRRQRVCNNCGHKFLTDESLAPEGAKISW